VRRHHGWMHRRTLIVLAFAACLILAGALPAAARGVEKRGHCSGGAGDWKISVRSEYGGKLRVRFEIEHVPAGQAWQIFLSDNGIRVFSGTRRSDGGDVRVTVYPANRGGKDRIAASAVSANSGVSCEGTVAF
jgi:hypothetical protein